jgi:signal peptidase II
MRALFGEYFPIFPIFSVAVVIVARMFRQSPVSKVLFRTALTMILAGAIGNFCDRLMLKYVIDWLHFHWTIFGWEYSFPVFNVADISIDVGIGLILIDSWRESVLQKRLDAMQKKTVTTTQAATVNSASV